MQVFLRLSAIPVLFAPQEKEIWVEPLKFKYPIYFVSIVSRQFGVFESLSLYSDDMKWIHEWKINPAVRDWK
jgi:hypothetical protein